MIEMLRIYSDGFLKNVTIEELPPWRSPFVEFRKPPSQALDPAGYPQMDGRRASLQILDKWSRTYH